MIGYTSATPDEVPDLAALLAQILLVRLGGQATIAREELIQVSRDYAGMRIALDMKTDVLTLTMKTELDIPPGSIPIQ